MLVLGLLLTLAGAPGAEPACTRGLEKGLVSRGRGSPAERIRGALEVLGSRCPELPEGLRQAAAKAARKPRAERSAILGRAAAAVLAEGCRPADFTAPATALAGRCRLPEPLEASEQLLADLDEGSYGYGLAVLAALAELGVRPHLAARWFDTLALGVGLEGYRVPPRR